MGRGVKVGERKGASIFTRQIRDNNVMDEQGVSVCVIYFIICLAHCTE